jgi:hypothetical protein
MASTCMFELASGTSGLPGKVKGGTDRAWVRSEETEPQRLKRLRKKSKMLSPRESVVALGLDFALRSTEGAAGGAPYDGRCRSLTPKGDSG